MALLQCSECAGMVSDKASSCPHCGAPIEVAQAAGKPSAPKPAVQGNVRTLGTEVLSNQAAEGSSDPRSAPVPTTGLAPSDSTTPSPVSDPNASSHQPPSLDAPPAVPGAVPPDQSPSFAGRNFVAFLVMLVFFAGPNYVPDVEVGELSLRHLPGWPTPSWLAGLLFGMWICGSPKENPTGGFAFWAAILVAYYLNR